jgi:hypothetical protein
VVEDLVVEDLVVEDLVVEATGLVFWQVAPLQYPLRVPAMHGTPNFLRTLVSQTMEALHLGLL